MRHLISIPSLRWASKDVPAGVVVFLVALPLCLGIALASGAPLFAGVIAGVIGGLIISVFSGSELSVSGPAAGLASVVAASIISLGSFEVFLTSVVLAGILQLVIAAVRAGSLGNFIPHSVIKGMLAAIGITIILKQIPHAVGYDHGFTDEEKAFAGAEWFDIFLDPIRAFDADIIQPGAIVISAVCLSILLVWDSPLLRRQSWTRIVPGALICVILAAVINQLFGAWNPAWMLKAEDSHMVSLPVATSLASFFAEFRTPDLSAIGRIDVWTIALTIAAIGSIESILSVEAADKMDPQRRISDVNRELFAQGIGNTISGLIGGLPVTSVIVRSSANVYAGAQTRTASFIHGALLAGAVVMVPWALNLIPLACFACVLLVVGYKLSSVSLIRSMWKEGISQFLPFIVTCVVVVATDILLGVAAGLIVSTFFVIRSYHRTSITLVNDGKTYLLRFNKDMTFVQKASLKQTLATVPDNTTLIIDGTKALYIDHDVYETIDDFRQSAEHRNITLDYYHFFGKQGAYSS